MTSQQCSIDRSTVLLVVVVVICLPWHCKISVKHKKMHNIDLDRALGNNLSYSCKTLGIKHHFDKIGPTNEHGSIIRLL